MGVHESVIRALKAVGNPSSIHGCGRTARCLIEEAREALAQLVGTSPPSIIFTSGGTEAAALALQSLPAGPRLVSSIEHPCMMPHVALAEPFPVTQDGCVDLAWLEDRLARPPKPGAVVTMLANNETGVIQPIRRLVDLAHAAGAVVLCDAVQALGKIPIGFDDLGVDAMVVSGHKCGAPQGVGALVVRDSFPLIPLVVGGGQERGQRGGTPNTPGIAGFGAAVRSLLTGGSHEQARLNSLHIMLEDGIRTMAPQARIWGMCAPRLSTTTCVGLPGVDQQRQVMALDLSGVAVSAGSACSSGKVAPSHVLMAMGATNAQACEAIRISLGWATTESDIQAFLRAWEPLVRASEK